MFTFTQFLDVVCRYFPEYSEEIRSSGVNMVNGESISHGIVAYMVSFQSYYIDYELSLRWTYVYQGVKGTGNTLKEALDNHKSRSNK